MFNFFKKNNKEVQIVSNNMTILTLQEEEIKENKLVISTMIELLRDHSKISILLKNTKYVEVKKINKNKFLVFSKGWVELNKEECIYLLIEIVNATNTVMVASNEVRYSSIYSSLKRKQEYEENSKLENWETSKDWQDYINNKDN